jgi:hypothetical protein
MAEACAAAAAAPSDGASAATSTTSLPKMTHDELVDAMVKQLRTIQGWETERGFVLYPDKVVREIATILVTVTQSAIHEKLSASDEVDLKHIEEAAWEKVRVYLERYHAELLEKENPEEVRKLQEEHQARRAEQESEFLIDVLTDKDTVTALEREICMRETVEKLKRHHTEALSASVKNYNDEVMETIASKPKMLAHFTHVQSMRRVYWQSVKGKYPTMEKVNTARETRLLIYLHMLQALCPEMFKLAKQMYDEGIPIYDKKGNHVFDATTRKQQTHPKRSRCVLIVSVPDEASTAGVHMWNWRTGLRVLTEEQFYQESMTHESMTQNHVDATGNMLHFVSRYDPRSQFVVMLQVACLPAEDPGHDLMSKKPEHQWDMLYSAHGMPFNGHVDRLKMPETMYSCIMAQLKKVCQKRYINPNVMPDMVLCVECRSIFVCDDYPKHALELGRTQQCRPCNASICGEDAHSIPFVETGQVFFCSAQCALSHTVREHPDYKPRFVKVAEEKEAARKIHIDAKAKRQLAQIQVNAQGFMDDAAKEAFIAEQTAEVLYQKRMALFPEEARKEAHERFIDASLKDAELADRPVEDHPMDREMTSKELEHCKLAYAELDAGKVQAVASSSSSSSPSAEEGNTPASLAARIENIQIQEASVDSSFPVCASLP